MNTRKDILKGNPYAEINKKKNASFVFIARCSRSQFECDDGQCIPFSWKCDEEFDCNDRSDEFDCRK